MPRLLLSLALILAFNLLTSLISGSVQAQVPFPAPPAEDAAPEAAPTSQSLQSLLDVLRDEAARNALIGELEAVVDGGIDPDPAAETTEPEQTVARRVADSTAQFAEGTLAAVASIWRDLRGIRSLFAEMPGDKMDRFANGWGPLLLTIASTVAIVWILTRAIDGWLRRGQRTSRSPGLRATFLAVVINALADAVVLVLGYAAGLLLALLVFGQDGDVTLEQTLYLNAFLVAGAIRIAIRAFVHPDRPDQAISHLSAAIQRTIYNRVKLVNFLLVYGIVAAVPIANAWFSLGAGRSIRIIVVTLAAIIALLAIRKVSRMLASEAQTAGPEASHTVSPGADMEADDVVDVIGDASIQAAATLWNRIWPWLASAYVIGVYAISVTRPRMMGEVIGTATLKTLGALALVALVFRVMKHAAAARAPVPRAIRGAMPELGGRLDGLAPLFLRLLGVASLLAAIALFVDGWGIVDVGGWLAGEAGGGLLWRVSSALLIVLFVILVWSVISSWIDHRLSLDLDGANVTARSRTLLALFRNAFTIAIFIFGIMIALSQLGIDIAPLLAGAGVIGLAIGFGSQKLVQDIITGVFIQLENAINEGDVVTVGGISGAVEKLTIRSVGLRDLNGIYHIVPFSAVDVVSNFMRKFSFHVEVVGIAYKENVPAAKDAMFEAFERLKAMGEHRVFILEDLDMHGVIALADSSVNIRARIKTHPGKQWAVGRAYTELVKEVFDERGIEIPFPHRQVFVTNETEKD
ncbi:MAG: mechanosensitive ion channel domain-containing protein [Pseudomonadota bacterium]